MTHNKWCLIYGSLVFSRSSTPRFHHESYIISIRWGLDAEEIKALHARLVGRERELDGSWRESSSDDWLYIDMIICHICVGLIRSGECGITQVVVSWRLAPSIEIIQVLQRTNAKKKYDRSNVPHFLRRVVFARWKSCRPIVSIHLVTDQGHSCHYMNPPSIYRPWPK